MINGNTKKGGGVAVYARGDLSCHVVLDFSVINPDIERFLLHLEKVLFVVLYRPASGDKKWFFVFFIRHVYVFKFNWIAIFSYGR